MAYSQKDPRQLRSSRDSLIEPGSVLCVDADEPEFDIRHYFRTFRRRRKLMAGVVIAVLLIGIAYTALQKPLYKSNATVLVQSSKASQLSGLANAASFLVDMPSLGGGASRETVTALMCEKQLLDDVFNSLNPASRRKGFGKAEKAPKWAVSISPTRNTDVIEVNALSHDARVSTELANSLIKEYSRQEDERNRIAVEGSRSYARQKMGVLGRQLKQANQRLAHFKRESGLVAPDTQLTKAAEYVATLQLDRQNTIAGLAALKDQMTALKKELAGQKTTVVSSSVIQQNPRLADALKSVDDLSRKRTELLQEYTPSAPEIKALDDQISSSQATIKSLARNIVGSRVESRNPLRDELLGKYSEAVAGEAASQARVTAIDAELEKKRLESLLLPEKERRLTELMQEVQVLERTYGAMSESYYTLLLSEKTSAQSIRVVSWARVDPVPMNRRIVRSAAASLVLGLLASVLLALGAEKLDRRVRDQKTAENISGHFASTVVPNITSAAPPILNGSAPSALLESFRVLRNTIDMAGAETRLKTIAVTSTAPKEGKSVTCVNLARAIAMGGRTVLVIDCNAHNPSIGQMMKAPYEAGLTNVLNGACSLNNAIAPTDLEGLNFLTTGPLMLNFPELLNTVGSRAVFTELNEKYDVVLIDCPPVSCLSDVQAISSLADAFLLVVALDMIEEEALAAAVHKLELLNTPVLSLVLRERDQAFKADTKQSTTWTPSIARKEREKANTSKHTRR